jgi:hypothetical protein
MSARRVLAYSSLNEIMPDVDRLMGGYRPVGRWSLGQICYHLGTGMRSAVEGGLPVKVSWWKRWLLGVPAKRHVLRTGGMPEGFKLPHPSLDPPLGCDDRAEAEALRATIRLFQSHTDPLPPHPLFGPMSGDEWNRFFCIHAAHHLSFLLPSAE